jgi:hypothetical protein
VVDNILWSLQLGDCKDDLKSVLVGEVQNTSAHMADSWGNFSDYSVLSFSVLSNSQFVFSFQFSVSVSQFSVTVSLSSVFSFPFSISLYDHSFIVHFSFP